MKAYKGVVPSIQAEPSLDDSEGEPEEAPPMSDENVLNQRAVHNEKAKLQFKQSVEKGKTGLLAGQSLVNSIHALKRLHDKEIEVAKPTDHDDIP